MNSVVECELQWTPQPWAQSHLSVLDRCWSLKSTQHVACCCPCPWNHLCCLLKVHAIPSSGNGNPYVVPLGKQHLHSSGPSCHIDGILSWPSAEPVSPSAPGRILGQICQTGVVDQIHHGPCLFLVSSACRPHSPTEETLLLKHMPPHCPCQSRTRSAMRSSWQGRPHRHPPPSCHTPRRSLLHQCRAPHRDSPNRHLPQQWIQLVTETSHPSCLLPQSRHGSHEIHLTSFFLSNLFHRLYHGD